MSEERGRETGREGRREEDEGTRGSYTVMFPWLTAPPRIDLISSAAILTVGEDFSLQCLASGPPPDLAPISITWYQNGTQLVPSQDPRLQVSESGTLTVYSADVGQSGVYTCNASTTYGFDLAQVSVTVGCE